MKKVLILVLTRKNLWPYDWLEETIRNTWGSIKNSNIQIWYYYGDSNTFMVEDDKIFCPFPEGFPTIGNKTIKSMEYLLNQDFDYIFRPNNSSFVNIPKLIEYIQTIPSTNFYGGVKIGYYGGGARPEEEINPPVWCCSGCGYILSRDLVELIVDNQSKWNHSIIDDLALCRFLKDYEITMTDSPRLSIDDIIEDSLFSLGKILSVDEISSHFHITTRADSMDRIKNEKMLRTLYKLIY